MCLRAEKLSESWEDAVFGGVFAEAGLPVAGPGRVIEVYGDSDAVGYGVRSETRDCPGEGVFLNTDSTLAFPALVARAFDADLELVARSGIGLIRDFSPAGAGGRMIDVADRVGFAEGQALPVDGERIVVIALGSNDFDMDLREGEPWADKAAMVPDFAAALRDFALDRVGAEGQVVLVAFAASGEALVSAHEAAVEDLRAAGVAVELAVVPEMGRHACDWHMDAGDQSTVAGLCPRRSRGCRRAGCLSRQRRASEWRGCRSGPSGIACGRRRGWGARIFWRTRWSGGRSRRAVRRISGRP